jgi:hypothetical protein
MPRKRATRWQYRKALRDINQLDWHKCHDGHVAISPRPLQQIHFLQAGDVVELDLGPTSSRCGRQSPLLLSAHRPDQASRFLLMRETLVSTKEELAFTAFEQLFAERGLPLAIRSDNGAPPSPVPMSCSTSPSSRSGGSGCNPFGPRLSPMS